MVISYPTPPYQNLPINPQYFQPSQFFISGVSLGWTTIVTTTVNHNYVVGQLVRLLIPEGYGCTGLNGKSGYVLGIPAQNQVQVNINSTGQNQFINANLSTQPQIIAIGEVGNGYTSTTGVNIPSVSIPGSFINISPL